MHFHFMDQLSNQLLAHPEYGLWITFILAFLESLPLFGTIFPGAVFMTVVGILAGRGLIGFNAMIAVSSIGAFFGDVIGFWIGRAFHDRIPKWKVFQERQHWLERGRAFFAKHGGKGVLIGRFFGPIRSTVPMVAGLLQMSWARFIPVALLAAFVWSIAYLVPGVLIGAISLQLSTQQVTLFLVSAVFVVILLWASYWLCQRFFLYLSQLGRGIIVRLWAACQRANAMFFLVRPITNPSNRDDFHQLTRVLLAFLLLAILAIFAGNVFTSGPLTAINHPIFYLLQSVHRPLLTDLMFGVTMLGDKLMIAIATLLITAVLLWQKKWRQARYFFVSITIAVICIRLFKLVFFEPRPMGLAHPATTSAYPSGHTTLATVFYGLLAYWIKQQLPQESRRWVTCAAVGLMGLVGFSRLYLGAHWCLDVLSAYCMGGAILLTSITWFRRRSEQSVCRLPVFLSGIALSVCVGWAFAVWDIGSRLFAGFQPIWPTQVVTKQEWLAHPTKLLPPYRLNRVGHPSEPMNVQWAGPLSCISANLLYSGWETITQVSTVRGILAHFDSSNPESHLFLFKRLYRQRPPVIYLMKRLSDGNRLAVLRLWSSGVSLQNKTPLWVGTVDVRLPRKGTLSFPSYHELRYNALAQRVLKSSFSLSDRPWMQSILADHLPKRLERFGWKGHILLLHSYNCEQR